MTKRQLRRIALAAEAFYILSGAETVAVTSRLSEEDAVKFSAVQFEVAESWLRRAGFRSRPGSLDEIFETVLNT